MRGGFLALSVAGARNAQSRPDWRSGGHWRGSNPATGSDIYNRDRGGDYPAWGAPGGVVPPDRTTGSGIRDREFRRRGMDTPSKAPNPPSKGVISGHEHMEWAGGGDAVTVSHHLLHERQRGRIRVFHRANHRVAIEDQLCLKFTSELLHAVDQEPPAKLVV